MHSRRGAGPWAREAVAGDRTLAGVGDGEKATVSSYVGLELLYGRPRPPDLETPFQEELFSIPLV